MISYSDLEFAIERWKARAAGVPQPAAPAPSGAVEAPMPVPTDPEYPAEEQEAGYVADSATNNPSGLVIVEGLSDSAIDPSGNNPVDPSGDDPVE